MSQSNSNSKFDIFRISSISQGGQNKYLGKKNCSSLSLIRVCGRQIAEPATTLIWQKGINFL